MRLVVTGAKGQVGWELCRSLMPLGEVIALDRAHCDLARPQDLPSLMRGLKPDVIVNAAAYTAVDKAEEEERLATTVNGIAPGILAEAAGAAGALFVHYSTDYVFDGAKDAPYGEDDEPHPINAYGRSKLAGDMAVRQVAGDHVILRTSWVYAARGQNFLRTVLRLARKGDDLRIVSDQIGAPTWARNIADATALIVQAACRERAEGRFASGLFNLAASGATSWHGFAEAILAELGKRPGSPHPLPKVHPIPSADYPRPAARPKNSRLSGERLKARFALALPDWRQALGLCIQDCGDLEARP